MVKPDTASVATRLIGGAPAAEVAAELLIPEQELVAWRDAALAHLEAIMGGTVAAAQPVDPAADLRLHHVGIVARDDDQIRRFAERLRLKEVKREYLPKYRVTNVFLSSGRGAQVQFMLPESGMLKNFNGGRGGLHHIAFLTDDVTPVQRRLEAEGVRFIAREKQEGIGGFRFNFVLPHLEGVSVELIEDPEADL